MSSEPGIDSRMLRRVALASVIGATVEWYDFFLFQGFSRAVSRSSSPWPCGS